MSADQGAHRDLARRCDETLDRIRARQQAAWLTTLLLEPIRQDGELLHDVETVLTSCRQVLETSATTPEIAPLVEAVGNEMGRDPAWIPAVLARLDLDALQVGPALPSTDAWPADERDRVRLARAVVLAAWRAGRPWAELTPGLARLLGPTLQGELHDEPRDVGDPQWMLIEAELLDESLRRPALVVRRGSDVVCVLKGAWWQVPRAPAPTDGPDALELWRRLPEPPESGVGAAPRQWFDRVREVPRTPGASFAELRASAQRSFRATLDSPTGEKWLHRLAQLAAREPAGWALPWLDALCQEQFCQGCYPRPTAAGIVWPAGTPLGPEVGVEFSDQPAGTLLRVSHYAETAAKAQCVFSLGPRENAPLAPAFERLARVFADQPPVTRALLDLHTQLGRHHLDGAEPATARPQAKLLLRAMTKAGPSLSTWEMAWPALREIVHAMGGTLHPASPSEKQEGLAAPAWIFSSEPFGQMVGVRPGVTWAGEVAGAGRLLLSAGTAPDGFVELAHLLGDRWPALRELPATPEAERASLVPGLFTEFFRRGGVRDTLEGETAERAATFLHRLARGLGFSLVTPGPGECCEANWRVETEAGGELHAPNLRVRGLRCPGLLRDGHLHLAPTVFSGREGP
ncbi:MAG: hypothetical protein U0840_12725 [Gemmataceae bacterium]